MNYPTDKPAIPPSHFCQPAGICRQVRRRYARSLQNLVEIYWPMADYAQLIDNSGREPRPIAEKTRQHLAVFDQALYNQ